MSTLAFCELTENEMMEVNGGNPLTWLIVMGAVTATAAAWNAVETAGEKIGKTIYYATH